MVLEVGGTFTRGKKLVKSDGELCQLIARDWVYIHMSVHVEYMLIHNHQNVAYTVKTNNDETRHRGVRDLFWFCFFVFFIFVLFQSLCVCVSH